MQVNVTAPDIIMTPAEIAVAKERGRAMAAQAIIANKDSRKRVESLYGIEFCKNRWPEAYGRNL
jgi:hypothetical protein